MSNNQLMGMDGQEGSDRHDPHDILPLGRAQLSDCYAASNRSWFPRVVVSPSADLSTVGADERQQTLKPQRE